MTTLGYCVVVIDSRGSVKRGLKFEEPIKGKMVCIPGYFIRIRLLFKMHTNNYLFPFFIL